MLRKLKLRDEGHKGSRKTQNLGLKKCKNAGVIYWDADSRREIIGTKQSSYVYI